MVRNLFYTKFIKGFEFVTNPETFFQFIINNASSGVENPPSARPSPQPSPIPALLKYSVLRWVQNERDGEQKEHDNEQT